MTWTILPINHFLEYKQQWQTLNSASHNSPLLETDFIEPLLKHFGSGKEKLAIHGNTDNPSAMAIIEQTKLGRWSTFQPSQAPIGCWLQAADIATDTLTQSLMKSLPGPKLIFSITQQDPDLLDRPAHSDNLATLDYIETARITRFGNFDDYWSQRGKNLRQGLRRQRNRLERENISTELVKITTADQVREAVTAYGELESASWKSDTGTAVHIDNAQGAFYQELLETYCQKGCGVIYQYLFNNELAATDLCIANADSIIILKTTYDSSIKICSPAMLMRQDAFSEIFDQKLYQRIEFYGKVMDWHRKWSNEIRTMYHINRYPKVVSWLKNARK